MKRFFLLSIMAISGFCVLSAQSSFMGALEKMASSVGVNLADSCAKEEFMGYCQSLIEQFQKNGKKESVAKLAPRNTRATSSSFHSTFIERVRIPDFSESYTDSPKYYRIKNVATGEYLAFAGMDAPLTTVAEPDENTLFYFVNRNILGWGDAASFFNKKSEGKIFHGPGVDKWYSVSGFSSIGFYFNPLEDKSGFFISDDDVNGNALSLEAEELGNVWRYDPATGTVVIGELDEYATWVAEPLASAPMFSSESSDTAWYVIRNVENGKYLHYEGANSYMTTVTAPDTCSLFFAEELDGKVRVRNYSAGSLACAGMNRWSEEGVAFNVLPSGGEKQFFVSQSGDVDGNDIWNCNENGTVLTGIFGDNSVWEFERITNFREIFGLANNGNGGEALNNLVEGLVEMLSNDMVTLNQGFGTALGVLIVALYGASSHMDISQAEDVIGTGEMIEQFIPVFEDPKTLKEVRLYNTDYLVLDTLTGRVSAKSLATNSVSLVVNDINMVVDEENSTVSQVVNSAEHLHTNMWQFWIEGVAGILNNSVANARLIVYNTATQTYISSPKRDENGNFKVGLTPDKADAGRFLITNVFELEMVGSPDSSDLTEVFRELSKGYYGNINLCSIIDGDTCCLYLESPDDLVVSCIETASPDTIPGAKWGYITGTSVLDEEIYNHANDISKTYPEVLQQQYGLVQDGCYGYSTNYPSTNTSYSTCKLVDLDRATVFWTENVVDGEEKHYLQADLGEGNAVSSFYFYMIPNFGNCYNLPASVTVEGSNSEDGDFVALAENIEMPNLLYNMYYFSDLIEWDGAEYRYLRFTVNAVNAVPDGGDEHEFSLSEFYLFPDNDVIAQAKREIDGFFEEEYIGEEIVVPGAELLMRQAEYLLELNKDNHSANPSNGQYPTSSYNALENAYENVVKTDQNSVLVLSNALNEFVASLVKEFPAGTICLVESAWEEGFSKGLAFSVDMNVGIVLSETNPWDLRQWIKITSSDVEENPYNLEVFAYHGVEGNTATINFTMIPGWYDIYGSQKDAYNISEYLGEYTNYLIPYEYEGIKTVYSITEPATAVSNRNAAWYLTYVADGDEVGYVTNEDFILALADFGKTMKRAEYYYNGEKAGQFVYIDYNGVEQEVFNNYFEDMKPFYDLGPVEIVNMYNSGLITDEDVASIPDLVNLLSICFPNFVHYNTYCRLRGRESGNYMASDAEGGFAMSDMYKVSGELDKDVELNSIFCVQPTADLRNVNVASYEYGRYLTVVDGVLEYDVIAEDGKDVVRQTAFSNADGSIGLNGNFLVDAGTSIGVSGAYTGSDAEWDVETVDELPVKVSSVKFATFCAPFELQIPGGITAYVVYEEARATAGDYNIATGKVVPEDATVFRIQAVEGGVLPAGLPVILHAENAGTYYFKINYSPTLTTEEKKLAACGNVVNLLEGRYEVSYIPERDGYTHYILSNGVDGVGMYKVVTYDYLTSEDGIRSDFEIPSFRNNAHRAWLPMPNAKSNSAYRYFFSIGGTGNTTGIDELPVVEVDTENVIYDLQGRRLEKITRSGIYIVNGKRVFVK